jgi:hypothetical protein
MTLFTSSPKYGINLSFLGEQLAENKKQTKLLKMLAHQSNKETYDVDVRDCESLTIQNTGLFAYFIVTYFLLTL